MNLETGHCFSKKILLFKLYSLISFQYVLLFGGGVEVPSLLQHMTQ